MKVGDLVKFPASQLLAMIMNDACSPESAELWVLDNNYIGPNPTYMSLDMLHRCAVIVSQSSDENR